MTGARWRLLALALLAGAAASRLKLWYACRTPDSEACVWGKAYTSIGFPMETIVYGGLIFAALVLLTRSRKPP